MIKQKICLIAEGVWVDVQSNEVAIFNLIEGMAAIGFPVLWRRMSFFALLERDEGDPEVHKGKYVVQLNDKVLHTMTVDIDFRGGPRHRNVVRLEGLILTEPGRLSMRLEISDKVVAQYNFDVTAMPAQGIQQVAEAVRGPT